MRYLYFTRSPPEGDKCDGGYTFKLNFQQAVIKPRDILTQSPISFSTNGLPPYDVTDVQTIDISDLNAAKSTPGT